jgi:hypothetical protein
MLSIDSLTRVTSPSIARADVQRNFLNPIMAREAVSFPCHALTKASALALILLLPACKSRPTPAPDLRARIAAASASQPCHSPVDCINPSILAIERGYFITTFAGAKQQHAQVRVEALGDYLVRLPMSAWPRGPMIVISPSDDVYDSRSVYENLEEAERVCHSLGLDVQRRGGG